MQRITPYQPTRHNGDNMLPTEDDVLTTGDVTTPPPSIVTGTPAGTPASIANIPDFDNETFLLNLTMAQSFDAETYVNEILLKIQNHRNSGSVVVMGRAVPEQQNTSQEELEEFFSSLFNNYPLPTTAQERRAEI